MDTDYEGQLFLNEELITGQSPNKLAYLRNKHIGFVFQFHYLLAEFSVLENVMLPAKKLGEKSVMDIEKEARQKLGVLGIEHLAKKKASMISGGEKQRVAIARALINNPSLLMGDEPTGNLDSHNSDNVLSIFRQLREDYGLSLLIVTHDKDFADKSDRIITMEDGRILI
jgi:lipoprotein-releasing system ATP-binding protein